MLDTALAPEDSAVLDGISVVLPRDQTVAQLLAAKPLMPFDPTVLAFIEGLGRALREDPKARPFPELVALGYWARGANIKRLKARFEAMYPETVRMPRGLAFHVAPSNVDTIFVYSLLLSMLAGNTNLVRMSSRAGEQSGLLLQVLDRAFAAADPAIRAMIGVVRYDHDKRITDALSRRAALRIVWGGDATVGLIRQSPLAPSGTELVFPNRYSLAVFDADAWTASNDKPSVARAFINDALWFGQMACSSPRAVVWRGNREAVETASRSFWTTLDEAAFRAALEWQDRFAVGKLLAEQDIALVEGAKILTTPSNRIRVVRGLTIDTLGAPSGTGNGFFREFQVEALTDLGPRIARNWQTIVSHGIPAADWSAFLTAQRPGGIDRIVKVGTALNFDAIWDGMDLLSGMTRITALSV